MIVPPPLQLPHDVNEKKNKKEKTCQCGGTHLSSQLLKRLKQRNCKFLANLGQLARAWLKVNTKGVGNVVWYSLDSISSSKGEILTSNKWKIVKKNARSYEQKTEHHIKETQDHEKIQPLRSIYNSLSFPGSLLLQKSIVKQGESITRLLFQVQFAECDKG